MEITTHCSGCRHPFTVPARFAGSTVRCTYCGASFQVPEAPVAPPPPVAVVRAPAAARAAAAPVAPPVASVRRPAAAVRAAPPPPPPAFDDPFADALADLERTGLPADPAPAYRPAGGIALPANVKAPRSQLPTPPGYVPFPFADVLDTFVPPAALVVYGAYVIWQFSRLSSMAESMGGSSSAMGVLLVFVAALVFGIIVPMTLLGLLTAGKVMDFDVPSRPYLRMAAVVATAVMTHALITGVSVPNRVAALAPDAGAVLVPAGVFLAALWLMFRLKPIEFAFAAFCGAMFLVFGLVIMAATIGTAVRYAGLTADSRADAANFGAAASGGGWSNTTQYQPFKVVVDIGPGIPMGPALAYDAQRDIASRVHRLPLFMSPDRPFTVRASIRVSGSKKVEFRRLGTPARKAGEGAESMTVQVVAYELVLTDARGNVVSRDGGEAKLDTIFLPTDPDAYNRELHRQALRDLVRARLPEPSDIRTAPVRLGPQ